jgi:hypothetical protein
VNRNRVQVVVAATAVLAASLWWMFGGRTTAAEGELTVVWSGSQAGAARLPGTIAWCPVSRSATLEAISADTGVMISLFETDTLSAEIHPVVAPELRDQAPRPGAVVGLRWVEDTVAIRGYQSVTGLVHFTAVGATASGEFDVRMRSPVGSDTLVLRGSFHRLPVVASAVGCS